MKFHEKLGLILDRKGWNPARLLEKLQEAGWSGSRTTVYRWTNGERQPRLEDLKPLARVLGVSLDMLACDEVDILPMDSPRAQLEDYLKQTVARIGLEEAIQRLLISHPATDPTGIIPPNSTDTRKDSPPDRPARDRRA